ncbi:hypothetical protein PHJA_000089400 [Phtheirospermum japonicum]|uniref:Myb/SANT-like domain-containing protein n=1 Tax=Phtheirospermum japonicum TaxID=374723 RepID=A0A830B281_9LAMI|nr:hypothetical protein PHJA_000089400 [Phtheirospermum japonicum]
MESSTSYAKPSSGRLSRRTWSVEEELILIQGLEDLVVRGWKADNGFKAGYAFILEKHIGQHFPDTDIKAEPYITSKMHVWKKSYGSLSLMQSRSGFGWNDSSNTIMVDREDIWDEHVKFDPNCKSMRYKTWPYFKDWIEIVGKDRATGENTRGYAYTTTEPCTEQPPKEGLSAPYVCLDEDIPAMEADDNSGTS